MPISQLLPDIYVPTFEIVVNGLPLSPLFARKIIQVSVTESLEPPNQFSFQLHAPTLELIDIQDGALTEGSRVELHIGYVGNTQKMITGEIAALTADFSSDGPATLQVDGFDLLHRLTRGTFYRIFEELHDSQIVSRIASEMVLNPAGDSHRVALNRECSITPRTLTSLQNLPELTVTSSGWKMRTFISSLTPCRRYYPTRMGQNAHEFFATPEHCWTGERGRGSRLGSEAKTEFFCARGAFQCSDGHPGTDRTAANCAGRGWAVGEGHYRCSCIQCQAGVGIR